MSELKGKFLREKSQTIDAKDMTPLAQSNLEHGQDVIDSKSEHVETPVDHENIQQGSMAPPTAISTRPVD